MHHCHSSPWRPKSAHVSPLVRALWCPAMQSADRRTEGALPREDPPPNHAPTTLSYLVLVQPQPFCAQEFTFRPLTCCSPCLMYSFSNILMACISLPSVHTSPVRLPWPSYKNSPSLHGENSPFLHALSFLPSWLLSPYLLHSVPLSPEQNIRPERLGTYWFVHSWMPNSQKCAWHHFSEWELENICERINKWMVT